MSDHLLVATRKGLFALERRRSGWTADLIGFAGIPVTNALRDNGTIYAALKHGHFGPKLHRSNDDGKSWHEIGTPAFPADTPDAPSLFQIWSLDTGGPHHSDRLWIVPFLPVCSAHARAGLAAATMPLAFTPCRRTRAMETEFFSPFPAAAFGKRAMMAPPGRRSARGLLRPMCRRSRPRTVPSRIRIASRAALRRRT